MTSMTGPLRVILNPIFFQVPSHMGAGRKPVQKGSLLLAARNVGEGSCCGSFFCRSSSCTFSPAFLSPQHWRRSASNCAPPARKPTCLSPQCEAALREISVSPNKVPDYVLLGIFSAHHASPQKSRSLFSGLCARDGGCCHICASTGENNTSSISIVGAVCYSPFKRQNKSRATRCSVESPNWLFVLFVLCCKKKWSKTVQSNKFPYSLSGVVGSC